MKKQTPRLIRMSFCITIVFAFYFFFNQTNFVTAEDKNKQLQAEIESALFTETEFFGTQTFVPVPTDLAEENLSKIAEKYPNEPQVILQLARLNEKLSKFSEAETNLQKLVEFSDNKINSLETLSAFYHRRANFEKEAETIESILEIAPKEYRDFYFSKIIELAEKNELEKYLKPEFYEQFINENPFSFNVIKKYLDKLVEENNKDKALNFIRESKNKLPKQKIYFLEKEVSLLPPNEAEKVYIEAFDPFWSDELSNNFYNCLSENDRLRAYGVELRKKFKRDKSNFDTAIRLIDYRNNDYKYGNDSAQDIILQLERVRKEKNIKWTSEELLILSRILLSENNGDLASRFLYTLFLQDDVQQKGEMRAKVLYQLFEVFVDANNEKLPLTKGDLKFYEDIAKADSNPGISTGILSLIFSDANIRQKFEAKEENSVQLFNLSAAYNLFSEYKKEEPTSKQLAQMYLDIVRLYTSENELEIAEKTLSEFEQRFEKTEDFADVALKLADAFIFVQNFEKEREIYQRILDYLGKHHEKNSEFMPSSSEISEPTDQEPNTIKYPFASNLGVKSFYSTENKYTDFLDKTDEKITYQQILNRLVSSLAKDNKTKEILAVYVQEIKKYPKEQGLYEQLLQWLGRTNLVDEQLKTYKTALKQFPTQTWRDRLSRWFIRREKMKEFGEFSHELLENFNDVETEDFLSNFVDEKALSTPESFNGQLYLGLYSLAHKRFPHNQNIVLGLLRFYKNNKQEDKWRELLAKYYFESNEIREEFLLDLAKQEKLREFLFNAKQKFDSRENLQNLPYKLFYADASRKLSNFEEAIDTYKLLDNLYPNTPEFTEPLINLTRSFGQKDRKALAVSGELAKQQADSSPISNENRTRSGEIQAELGNYENARNEWNKLLEIESGDSETFLNTATVFWDYFQFENALKTIEQLRAKTKNNSIYAFQMAAIYEAQNRTDEALGEYIKALGNDDNFHQTKNRLTNLYKRKDISDKLQTAFVKEKSNPHIVLGYSRFLSDIEKEKGLQFVRQEVTHRTSHEFLSEALSIFKSNDDLIGEQITLKQLAKTNKSPRTKISYELRLAENYSEMGEKNQASVILGNLINKYPTNYGVLNETSDFYWRIGEYEKAINILKTGMNRGIGKFHYHFGRKLALRLKDKNHFSQAEQILLKLFEENKADSEVFSELTTLFVQTNKPQNLRTITDEAFAQIKKQDLEPRELNYELTERRKKLIDAFTRLKDYDSAIEQHIEIINLKPESSENVEEAIAYVNRYGGAEKLLDYYKKTAAESYKNYRWFVILARVYEANNDYKQAIENYKVAIHNQPELPELYELILQNYLDIKDHSTALETVNKLLELTNSKTVHIKQKIEILTKLGRLKEAEILTKKLPLDERPKTLTITDKFVDASQLKITEQEKSIKTYREAFAELNEKPFESVLRPSDITGYVETIRQVDDLDEIFKDFWNLREKIIAELEDKNSINAGKARDLLQTIDGTLPKAIGQISQNVATNKELSTLFTDFEEKIKEKTGDSDKYKTLSFLQNLIRECDFEDLEEKILIAKKDEAFSVGNAETYHRNLEGLLEVYKQRSDFRRILEILEKENLRDKNNSSFPYSELIAQNSKLLGDITKESQALEDYYRKTPENLEKDDKLIRRYFELLLENNKQTLTELAENNSKHRIQFINFLIEKGEKELVHKSIVSSNFSEIWKLSRNAETSLVFGEFENENEMYFSNALQIAPIGEMIKQNSKLKQNEWFKLSQTFGKWLYFSNKQEIADSFLPAKIENRPGDFKEQMRLGNFYLMQKNFRKALEHFQIAYELEPNNKSIYAKLGVAYFQIGSPQKSEEFWKQIVENNPTIDDAVIYLKTLSEYGQSKKARAKLKPFILQTLKAKSNNESTNFIENQDKKSVEHLSELLETLAKSFRKEDEKTRYFLELCKAIPDTVDLPEILIKNVFIENENLSPFYELIIDRSEGLASYYSDSEFKNLAENIVDLDEAESLYEQESEAENNLPDNEKIRWQKECLEYLLKEKSLSKAKMLIKEIENSIAKRYVRPNWLRLANIELSILENDTKQAINTAQKFIGIEVSKEAKAIKPPNLERFNQVLVILEKQEKHAEILELKKDFYARKLALEVFDFSSFMELAKIAVTKNDLEFAKKILRLMCEISKETGGEKSQRELAEISLIKAFSEDVEKFAKDEKSNSLSYPESLRFAAEVSSEVGFLKDAKLYRAKLLNLEPQDAESRVEYARLAADTKDSVESVTHLSYIINDRNVEQTLRWQAIIVLGEIIKTNTELREKLSADFKPLQVTDVDLWKALELLKIVDDSHKSLNKSFVYKSHFWKHFRTNCEYENANVDANLRDFSIISNADKQEEISSSFGFACENPVSQIIRSQSPLAALKIFEKIDFFPPTYSAFSNSVYPTLKQRTESYQINYYLDTFRYLSKAAEDSGDFSRAIEFENLKISMLENSKEKNLVEKRINDLKLKIEEQNEKPKISFRLNKDNISAESFLE